MISRQRKRGRRGKVGGMVWRQGFEKWKERKWERGDRERERRDKMRLSEKQ